MHRPVILETERLILRPHGLDDFPPMADMWAEPQVVAFIGATPSTTEESWQRLLRYRGLWSLLGFGYFALTDKHTGAFLGEAGLADFHRDILPSLDGFAEAGWALKPAVWGNGYACEALTAIFNWYDETPKPRPMACIIDPQNVGSQKLALKTGFVEVAKTHYRGTVGLMFHRGD